jgi:hypothetical protein
MQERVMERAAETPAERMARIRTERSDDPDVQWLLGLLVEVSLARVIEGLER